MAGEVRKKMVVGAVQLLARRGLQATSFAEVLDLTGAPRGSVYHHFPEGKDQMVGEAVDLAGAFALACSRMAAEAGAAPARRAGPPMKKGLEGPSLDRCTPA